MQKKNTVNNTSKDYGSAISNTMIAAGNIYDGTIYGRSWQDLQQNAGTGRGNVSGYGYVTQNYVDRDKEMSTVNKENVSNTLKSVGSGAAAGAAVGSIIPGVGTAIGAVGGAIIGGIGGLFGSSKRKSDAENAIKLANIKANITNNFNRSVASTSYLQNKYYSEYGNAEDQMLYAKHGKDQNVMNKRQGSFEPVETSEGIKYDVQNAWTSAGEGIYNPLTGAARLITHGQNDTAKTNLKSEDVVYGDLKNPKTGNSFKKDAAPYIIAKETLNKKRPNTDDINTLNVYEAVSKPLRNALDAKLLDLADTLATVRQYNDYTGIMKAKHGKNCTFPRFDKGKPYLGWLPNAIVGSLGTGIGLALYFDAKRQDVYKPNTYVANPYESESLRKLDSLRLNAYPILKLMRDAATQSDYRINMSGGLSGALKYLAKVANYNNLFNSIANTHANILQQNINLNSSAAQARLQVGAQNATNRMAAMRADDDIYMKGHAARLAGMQTGLFNISNALQQYIANENKRRIGRGTIGIYDKDLMNLV